MNGEIDQTTHVRGQKTGECWYSEAARAVPSGYDGGKKPGAKATMAPRTETSWAQYRQKSYTIKLQYSKTPESAKVPLKKILRGFRGSRKSPPTVTGERLQASKINPFDRFTGGLTIDSTG
jgi:hypothetical protein